MAKLTHFLAPEAAISNKQPRSKHYSIVLSHGRYLIKHTAVVITTLREIAAETPSSDYQIDVVGLFG